MRAHGSEGHEVLGEARTAAAPAGIKEHRTNSRIRPDIMLCASATGLFMNSGSS
jgi:hypothetical protein